jgi:hypothetical protein
LSAETPHPTAPRIAIVAITLSFALAAGVGILRTVNAEPVERTAEVAGNIAFAVVFAVPALLAILGLRRRPSLLVAAGVLDLMLAVVTLITLIGLVFVAPGVMFLIATSRMRNERARPLRSVVSVLVGVLLSTGAFLALFARDDPICWATIGATGQSIRLDAARSVNGSSISMDSRDLPSGTTESGCSSDFISNREAALATAVVAVMLGAVWVVSIEDADRPSSQVNSRPEHGGVAQR